MSRPAVVVLQASSIAPAARAWVAESHSARLLHVFNRSCNLINDRGRILSLVAEEIGAGPFNAVVPDMEYTRLDADTQVDLRGGCIGVAGAVIDLLSARLWNPCPHWELLHGSRALIRQHVGALNEMALHDGPIQEAAAGSLIWQRQTDNAILWAAVDLSTAINSLDGTALSNAAACLAGLGEGLTPSGDDVLMGALHASWVVHKPGQAAAIGSAILDAARHRTTALSLAWLEAAARGEAAARWHGLLSALLLSELAEIEASLAAILGTGHTSGRAAWYGFTSTLLNLLA